MNIKKTTLTPLSAIIFSVNSNIAVAADISASEALFPGWPLLLLLILVLVFRKKIFIDEMSYLQDLEPIETEESKKSTPVTKEEPASDSEHALVNKPVAKVSKEKTKPGDSVIDISDDGKRCQAKTAKGTQCKRTTSLAKTIITVGSKAYQLIVCSQHNNKKLKPFPKLPK